MKGFVGVILTGLHELEPVLSDALLPFFALSYCVEMDWFQELVAKGWEAPWLP